jgi:hypothetical protein
LVLTVRYRLGHRADRPLAISRRLRLQLLLRLSPINPVTVSYVLGASGVRFSTFMIATIGLIPTLFVEVYFGDVASHLAKVAGNSSDPLTLHTVVVVVGFAERQQASEARVRAWCSAQELPFPTFTADYRKKTRNTHDYPPEGSPQASE